MENNKFFDFSSKPVSSAIQAGTLGLEKDKKGIHLEWNLIKGKYAEINFPVLFKQDYGKKLTDILNTGWVSLFLISDRMKSILKENQLSGWKDYPIKLYDKKGAEIPGYSGFSVTGTCKSIDYSKSEIIEKSAIPGGPVFACYKGSHVDDWDGTDFFAPVDSYQIIITGKATEILKENKITNMKLIDLVDFEIPVRYTTGI